MHASLKTTIDSIAAITNWSLVCKTCQNAHLRPSWHCISGSMQIASLASLLSVYSAHFVCWKACNLAICQFLVVLCVTSLLCKQVQVLSVQRVNSGFNARSYCNTRTYHYFLPASILGLALDGELQWHVAHCKLMPLSLLYFSRTCMNVFLWL